MRDLAQSLHDAMHSAGCKGEDIHLIVDWIGEDFKLMKQEHLQRLQELRSTWVLRAAGMGVIGAAAGAVLALVFQ